MRITIISGGQTGVDRAALDFALQNDIPCGGFCPMGRKAEDGPIHKRYPLIETSTGEYDERTEKNVQHSDGTLILTIGTVLTGGTLHTKELADKHQKSLLVIDLSADPAVNKQKLIEWIGQNRIIVMNVAGPRESADNDIYRTAMGFLEYSLMNREEGLVR